MDGEKMRDQLMARIHVRETRGKGGKSFLLLRTGEKGVFVLD